MRRRFDPVLPRERGWPRFAIAVSILLHILLFLGPVESRLPTIEPPPEQIVALPRSPSEPSTEPPLFYLIPWEAPRSTVPAERGERPGRGTGSRGRATVESPAAVPIRLRPAPVLVDSGTPATAARPSRGRVAPDYGNGVLWVRPVPVSPEELARRLEAEHFEQVDSAVIAILGEYLDSLSRVPGPGQEKLPEWTTNIAGSKLGLDSRFIYIAGLKIPTALLALLPLPQGNIDQARKNNHLMDLRADIERAARRADNMDELKRAIREIRDRKQRERDFERAQRETPPPPPPKDPPTP